MPFDPVNEMKTDNGILKFSSEWRLSITLDGFACAKDIRLEDVILIEETIKQKDPIVCTIL